LVMRGLDPRIYLGNPIQDMKMDCRVKPGNDAADKPTAAGAVTALRLDDDVIVLDPHRERLRHVGAFDQLGSGLDLDRILPHAQPARIAPRLAGANVEFPAVPGALHHLAEPRVAVVAGLLRFDEPGLDAVGEAAAAMRAAVVEGKIIAAEVEHH